VIIPAFNEERWLPVCLEALVKGTVDRSRYEILVIDNGSTDRTAEIAANYADEVIAMTGGNVSIIRNEAARKARGTVLAFLDSDCIPAPDWLECGLAAMEVESCVSGAPYGLPENPSWVERNWDAGDSVEGRKPTSFVLAGNCFIPRSLFEELGGFNDSLRAGEDKELCSRAARLVPVVRDDRIRVVHEGNPKTLKHFVSREIWHGRGAFESLRTNGKDRMVACSIAFALATLMQIAGLAAWMIWSFPWLFLAGTAGIVGILALVLLVRRRQLRGFGHAVRYTFLSYVYFIGRSIALCHCVFSIDYYHGITSTKAAKAPDSPV